MPEQEPIELRKEECNVLLRFRTRSRITQRRVMPVGGETVIFKRLDDYGLLHRFTQGDYGLTAAGMTVLTSLLTVQGKS